MPNFFLFHTHKINVTNLIMCLMVRELGRQCYLYSDFEVKGSKLFHCKLDPMPTNFRTLEHSNHGIRNINWTNVLSILDHEVSQSVIENKIVIFGNHQISQIELIKSKFCDKVVTIGISYTENDYPALIKNMSEYHVYLLKNQLIEITVDDQAILEGKTTDQLIAHYTSAFDNMSLIPKSSTANCDHNIPVSDFVVREAIIHHFDHLGVPLSADTLAFYDQWLAHYTT